MEAGQTDWLSIAASKIML